MFIMIFKLIYLHLLDPSTLTLITLHMMIPILANADIDYKYFVK